MLIQPWIKVMYYSLLCLTLHIKAGINISHLSISGIVAHGRCYISHCFFCLFFFKTVCLVMLVLFKYVINLTSFLFKSKFISFRICDSAHLLSHYYYCYNYYFYYYLLLIYIYIYIYIYLCQVIFNVIAFIIIFINSLISFFLFFLFISFLLLSLLLLVFLLLFIPFFNFFFLMIK